MDLQVDEIFHRPTFFFIKSFNDSFNPIGSRWVIFGFMSFSIASYYVLFYFFTNSAIGSDFYRRLTDLLIS